MKLICDGGISCAPDTIDAIMLTKNIDYIDGIKIDVRKTMDNVLVLAKNDDLSKYTMSNRYVSTSHYDYIRNVKFNTHIFKYYIPTLDEVLIRYAKNKVIILNLCASDNIDLYLELVYSVISKYPYQYYYISDNEEILSKISNTPLNNLGIIINNDNLMILNDKTNNQTKNDISNFIYNKDDNFFLITNNPIKFNKKTLFDKKGTN